MIPDRNLNLQKEVKSAPNGEFIRMSTKIFKTHRNKEEMRNVNTFLEHEKWLGHHN